MYSPSSVTTGSAGAHAKLGARALVGEARLGSRPAEGEDGNRDGGLLAEPAHALARVADDDELLGGRGDDLLAEEGGAEALDEVERGVDLVGAVDADVERARAGVEVEERDAELVGEHLGAARGGDADHGHPAADPLGERLDEVADGRASADADDLAILDVLGGPAPGGALLGLGETKLRILWLTD